MLESYVKPDSGFTKISLHDSTVLTTQASRAWLDTLGFEGEFVATPGHSDDSVSLVLDGGLALTGDLPFPFMVDEVEQKTVGHGWAKLRTLSVPRLYPGHGPFGVRV